MLLLIFLVACPVVGAFALTYLYDKQATLVSRLAAGIAVGQTLAGFIGYMLAARWGLTAGTMGATATVCLLPLLVFVSAEKRVGLRCDISRLWSLHHKHSPSRWLLRGAFALTLALLLIMMRGAFTADATGYYTNNHNNLGDLAFHLAVVQNFVVGNNFPPQHPEFAHVPLTYPFLVDFIAAQWTASGLTLERATWLQNALLSFATLVLLQRWLLLLTRRALGGRACPLGAFAVRRLGLCDACGRQDAHGASLGRTFVAPAARLHDWHGRLSVGKHADNAVDNAARSAPCFSACSPYLDAVVAGPRRRKREH